MTLAVAICMAIGTILMRILGGCWVRLSVCWTRLHLAMLSAAHPLCLASVAAVRAAAPALGTWAVYFLSESLQLTAEAMRWVAAAVQKLSALLSGWYTAWRHAQRQVPRSQQLRGRRVQQRKAGAPGPRAPRTSSTSSTSGVSGRSTTMPGSKIAVKASASEVGGTKQSRKAARSADSTAPPGAAASGVPAAGAAPAARC